MNDKKEMIDRLVGVESSKMTYYTELKNTIREMEKKNIQLEIINDVMKSFNIDMSMDVLLKNVLEKLKHIFPIDRLSLMHLNNGALEITGIYPTTSKYVRLGAKIAEDRSLYWRVVRERKAENYIVSKSDAYIENRTFAKLGLKQVLIFPLFVKQKVIGLFSLASEKTIAYSDQDINFLQQLSDQIAVSTENARLYQEVLYVKNEWEKTFSAVDDYMFLVDLNGGLLRANKAARDFFAAPYENGKTRKCILFEELEKAELIDECVRTRRTVSCELFLEDKYFDVFAYPVFDEKDGIYSVIVYMKDVTSKRQYEVQLLQSGKLAAIGELAAGVAHELNNPLTAILGNSQILLRKVDETDDTYFLLEDIYQCGRRCKNIIQNLLTFSRQDEYMFEKFSLNDAVETVLGLIGYQLRQQQIRLAVELDETLPLIEGNAQQIEQVIINLLINARDALLESDRAEKRIIISTRHQDGFVQLTVEDNGTGIPEELHHEIFHPFFTTKRASKGTGLGLSVSHGIIESHGGKIELESEVGKGSKFTIKLPVTRKER